MSEQMQISEQATERMLIRVVTVRTPERAKKLFSFWEEENAGARRAGLRFGRLVICAQPVAAQLSAEATRLNSLQTALLQLPNGGWMNTAEIAEAIDAQSPSEASIIFADSEISDEVAARVAARRGLDLVEQIVRVSCQSDQTTWYCGVQEASPSKSYKTTRPIIGLCTFSETLFVIEGAAPLQDGAQTELTERLFPDLRTDVRQGEARIWSICKETKPVAGLSQARVLLAGGKGVGNEETFRMLEEVAKRLGVGIAASRSAVEMGWIGEQYQVGQSGMTVRPQLYVAFGIHGAIQHLSGMRQSQKIMAVNTDTHAPIYSVAHVGYVCDVQKLIPWMLEQLDEKK